MSLTATAASSSPQALRPTFLQGPAQLSRLRKPSSLALPGGPAAGPFEARAMKTMQGRVVCATSDKTVAVEVVRLAPHPKYKRRVRKMKKYQAHDPDNQFRVGDFVQLEKTRPISKTKTFLAVPVPNKNRLDSSSAGDSSSTGDLRIPLESQQQS